jgi:hypothetical protein
VADWVVCGVGGGVAEEDVCFGVRGVAERGIAVVVGHVACLPVVLNLAVCGWIVGAGILVVRFAAAIGPGLRSLALSLPSLSRTTRDRLDLGILIIDAL